MVELRYQTAFELYPYERVPDQDKPAPVRHPVVIVGGGPIGMGLALDLGKKGIACVVLDDHPGVGMGSRAICFAKRTLEICDRLGCGEPMVKKGVVWNLGRVFRELREIYEFNLLPEGGHKRPAFINLQQPYFEKFVVEEIRRQQDAGAPIDIRGVNRVTRIDTQDDHVGLEVDTPEGPYTLEAEWVVACDGANSPIRNMLGLGFEGRVFEDNFLIADIRLKAGSEDFPVERRFWFNPPFNPNETALMHKQPDGVWRLDFQLGWDIDRAAEIDPKKVQERVRGMIGAEYDFELVWTSIYTFRCCSMEEYRHGRVIFAGDSAHQVSPFGARGANGGMQDIDNLGWKLAMVVGKSAPVALLDSYHIERKQAAQENILNSTRSADFLTPRSPAHEVFRDAVLDLVEEHSFARPMINSGRLSTPCTYHGSPLSSADTDGLPDRTRPGAPACDAPLADGWLIDLLGNSFQILAINTTVPTADVAGIKVPVLTVQTEPDDLMSKRYLGAAEQAVYLLRPDQHVAARWTAPDHAQISAALNKAIGLQHGLTEHGTEHRGL